MRVFSAGDGVRYLMRTVAAGDGDRGLSTRLTRYYAEEGTPWGGESNCVWIGWFAVMTLYPEYSLDRSLSRDLRYTMCEPFRRGDLQRS